MGALPQPYIAQWHYGYENVGGDIDEVLSKRVTLAGFPIRWTKGAGSIVRLVAIVDEGDQ